MDGLVIVLFMCNYLTIIIQGLDGRILQCVGNIAGSLARKLLPQLVRVRVDNRPSRVNNPSIAEESFSGERLVD